MVSCENPINLHAPRKSVYRSGMPFCPRQCVFICAYFIRRAYYFVMKIHSPRELILLHLTRATGVFFRHLQYTNVYSAVLQCWCPCDIFRIMISGLFSTSSLKKPTARRSFFKLWRAHEKFQILFWMNKLCCERIKSQISQL